MNKISTWLFLVLPFLWLAFFFPKPAFAFSVPAPSDTPSSAVAGDAFTLTATISSGSGDYFIKCRVGDTSSSLNQGETYKSDVDQWFGDTDSWVSMPVVSTVSGSWSGSLSCRVKSSVSSGSKLLAVRVCPKEADGTCTTSKAIQSQTVSLTSISPTPTPTTAPTSTPTPTSGPTSAPTSTPKPTVTPTSKPTSAAVTSPAAGSSLAGTTSSEGSVLGNQATISPTENPPTPEPEKEVKVASYKTPIIASVLILAGLGLVSFSGYSFWQKHKKVQSKL